MKETVTWKKYLLFGFGIYFEYLLNSGASLVAQGWGNLSANAGDTGSILDPEHPVWHTAAWAIHHNYWAWALEPGRYNYCIHVLQPRAPQEKPPEWEGHNATSEQPLLSATRDKPVKKRRPSTAKNKNK